jgi:hypothetical protein
MLYASAYGLFVYSEDNEFKDACSLYRSQTQTAENYLKAVLAITGELDTRLLIATNTAIVENTSPTSMQIAKIYIDMVKCQCNQGMEYKFQLAACHHILYQLKVSPNCQNITLVDCYFWSESRYPNRQELICMTDT